jgi:putative RecB family exonuclease
MCDWCDHKPCCPAFGGTPPPYPGWPDPSSAREDDDHSRHGDMSG